MRCRVISTYSSVKTSIGKFPILLSKRPRRFFHQFTATSRWFKKVVYQTNHINVEKLLLEHESLRQSVRLILLDTWLEDEPKVTGIIKDIYRLCPTLFDTMLSRIEQQDLRSLFIQHEDEQSEATLREDGIQADTMHKHVTATGQLRINYCKDTLQVPTRASDPLMTPAFKSQLREAFTQDYNIPNIMYFGVSAFQWFKKIAFTSG